MGRIANRILFCATVDFHFEKFHLPYMKWFKEQGWEVHIAAKGDITLPYVDKKYNVPFERSPLKTKNIEAYNALKAIIDENDYQLIHCHTPMGGVLARLAARNARSRGTKVIYTVHGFHFYSGAPLPNWLIYYPIEKTLAHVTDCLVTINEEDYNRAVSHRFKAQRIEHVHGVGVNADTFKPSTEQEKLLLRKKYNYRSNDFLMFYAAEFNKNKNHRFLIEALAKIKESIPNARLILAGNGDLQESYQDLAKKLKVEEMIDFLGYQNNILPYLQMSDIAVASSLREGLPVNIMEAMACGLPVIATDNRGHRELVQNHINGWVIKKGPTEMAKKIEQLANDQPLKDMMGTMGRSIIEGKYSTAKVMEEKSKLYASMIEVEAEVLKWASQ